MSASMSVTIIDVSDSLTSRDFAAARMGANRFNPDDKRSDTFPGMVMTRLLGSPDTIAGNSWRRGVKRARAGGSRERLPEQRPNPFRHVAVHVRGHFLRVDAHLRTFD